MTKERAAKIILDMINGAESTFGHSLSATEINALKKAYCALNPEPTTNADHIRKMNDDELAEYLAHVGCRHADDDMYCLKQKRCKDCWLDGLREECDP